MITKEHLKNWIKKNTNRVLNMYPNTRFHNQFKIDLKNKVRIYICSAFHNQLQ